MTKALFASYQEARLDNGVDLISGNVKVAALDASYVYDNAHQFFDDVTGVVASSSNLTSKSNTGGVFNSDPANLGSPAPGDTVTQYVMYRDTGTPATSELVYYFNEDAAAAPISWATDGTPKTVTPTSPGWFR